MSLDWSKDEHGRYVAKGRQRTYVIVRDRQLNHYVACTVEDDNCLRPIQKAWDHTGKPGYGILHAAKAAAERLESSDRGPTTVPHGEPSNRDRYLDATVHLAECRFDAQRLLSDAASFLSPGAFERLPAVARVDFEEGCKSIAYGLPNGAACLLVRSAEAALREFYSSLTGRTGSTWDEMERELGAPGGRNELRPLVGHLASLRRSYRNPTMHAAKVYDLEEAQDLLSLCTIILNNMDRLLTRRDSR